MGVRQIYPGRYLPDVLLKLIKTEGVTFSHCVPTILHIALSYVDTYWMPSPHIKWRIGRTASSPASRNTVAIISAG